ncbi:uncharacterized protein TNCV_213311 [Trichonephila clavipes]|nr:uncharacterized protein TNCV_213311 [Trichonephila clavipes]
METLLEFHLLAMQQLSGSQSFNLNILQSYGQKRRKAWSRPHGALGPRTSKSQYMRTKTRRLHESNLLESSSNAFNVTDSIAYHRLTCYLATLDLNTLYVAAVAEWYRYRTVACLVTSSSPVPLKTRRVGQRCTLNLSRAETSSRWSGVVVRRRGASSGVVHVT